MANYEGTARSNYFPFIQSQLDLIEQLFTPHDIQVVHKDGLVAIISLVSGTPDCMIDTPELEDILFQLGLAGDDIDNISLLDVIHHLLPAGETLIWVETGHEKARYLVGQALRINDAGAVIQGVDLNSVYSEGESRAEY